MLGDTRLAKDWSLHSITPYDYNDVAVGTDLEGVELLASQSMAAVSFYLFTSLLFS